MEEGFEGGAINLRVPSLSIPCHYPNELLSVREGEGFPFLFP